MESGGPANVAGMSTTDGAGRTGGSPARILAYQPGIYPRSELVVAATRGLERGRVTQAEVDSAYHQDLVDFVQLQQEARLDFFSDGLLRWHDIFRPLAQAAGMPARILTRWFDNNAFF